MANPATNPEVNAPPPALVENPQASTEEEKHRAKIQYGEMQEIENLLFGEPGGAQESLARQAWTRLRNLEGYTKAQERVMQSMKNAAQKILDATAKNLLAKGKTVEESRMAREALNKYLRTVGVLGQAQKVVKTPYVSTGMSGSQLESTHEVMESTELAELERFTDFLNNLDMQELVDMILEDQEYVEMLLEEINADGHYAVADIVPIREPGQPENEKPTSPFSAGKSDLNQPENTRNANYQKLISFIMGETPAGKKEKSESRRSAEAVLWAQIVRAMSFDQKEFLLRTMTYERGAAVARDAMEGFLIAGCLSAAEIELYRQNEDEDELAHGVIMPKTVTDEFLKKTVPAAVKERSEYEVALKQAARDIENPQIRSAAMYFGTMNKFLWSRLIDFGFLTSGINLTLSVTQRYSERKKHGEGRLKALAKGVGEGLKNKWFWFGVGEMAAGTNGVYPWIRSALLAPGSNERQRVAQYTETVFFNGEAKAHPGAADYLFKNYEDLLELASKNKTNTNPKQKEGEERGTDELYVGDIELTAKQAGQMGYRNVVEAEVSLLRMFNVAKNILKVHSPSSAQYLPITNKELLRAYLQQNELKSVVK